MKLSMILARSMDNVIGINNDIPWKCPEDMKKFREITSGKAVVMGRNTWESLPNKPLPKRLNIVITTRDLSDSLVGAFPVKSVAEAIECARALGEEELIFIGGKGIYDEAVHIVDEVYLTEMNWNTLSDNNTGPDDTKVYFDYHFDYTACNPDQTWKVVEQYHETRFNEAVPGEDHLFEFLHLKRK